jgi:hypothetical protein
VSEPMIYRCRLCGDQPVGGISRTKGVRYGVYCMRHPSNCGHGDTGSQACHNWNANNAPTISTAQTVRP